VRVVLKGDAANMLELLAQFMEREAGHLMFGAAILVIGLLGAVAKVEHSAEIVTCGLTIITTIMGTGRASRSAGAPKDSPVEPTQKVP
jgi:hypothetical protein